MVKKKPKEYYSLYQNNNQFLLNIPTSIVMAKGWKKGKKLKFRINNKGNIEIVG